MPNALTVSGLQTASSAELVSAFTADFQSIYGPSINLDPSTPDGQLMMTFVQAALDTLDLLKNIYSSFDPDFAFGTTLDQRVAYNGIQRQAGTKTLTNISITTSQSVTLIGFNQDPANCYTVSDNAGNQFQLIDTQNPSVAGTYSYAFQAVNPGAVLTLPNTIINPVTIVLGVTAINNPTTYTTLGLNEETDGALRLRRQKSVQLTSNGFVTSLEAALKNLTGMATAKVYENTDAAVSSDGIPGHSIWAIVSGTASPTDIANAIYAKRGAGAGMKGSITQNVTQPDGQIFTARWDTFQAQPVYINFQVTSIDGKNAPNVAAIIAQLPQLYKPGINETMNSNKIAGYIQQIDPNALANGIGLSLTAGGPYVRSLPAPAKNIQLQVSSANITATVI